ASATRRDNSSSRVIFLSRASSTKLLASSASPQASAASMFCATTAGFSRRAESIWRSESSAGSSCVESKAPASRACGHSAASTAALTARPPRAEPSRRHFIRKTRYFHHPEVKIVCRFCDTTAPTKEGLLWDDKIVSNLHEQRSGGRCELRFAVLAINCTRQYGARHFELPREFAFELFAFAATATPGEYDVR